MARPEQFSEAMNEVDGKGLDESKRSPGSIPETAPAPALTDAELEQYRPLFDFDAATLFDADNPSHENSGSNQEQQVDFLNSSNETIQEETNSWYANAVATQINSDGLLEQNVEARVPEFTQEDQAVLDAFGPAIADEISTKYPTQGGLIMADSQSLQAPTAQNAVLQDLEQSSGTSKTNIIEYPASSRVQHEDDDTTQDQLDSLVEWTGKKYPSNSLSFDQYEETFLSAQMISSSPMNHDKYAASNHQGSQSSTKIEESAPVMTVQHPGFRQNQVGAAQNRIEHNLSRGQGEYNGYDRAAKMQGEDDWTYASPLQQYPDPSCGDFDVTRAPMPYPCLQAFDSNNRRGGIETQRAGNDPIRIENRVDNTNSVAQRSGNGQHGKASQGSKKRADWETRADAARPRVRMTEEEYQWLRPNEGPRDVFETQRRKVAEERLKEEADAEALEKAGMPRPQPKVQKPFKGCIHIEVWEKDRLNNRRLAQGKSGREIFSEKPKLRGKRKGREISESGPQPESKKQRLEQSGRFQPQPTNREMSEGMINGEYGSSMVRDDEFNYGISSGPHYAANPMTGQMNQGITSGGRIHNNYISNNYGNNYGNFYSNNHANNKYIGNHCTDTSFGNGVRSSGMTRTEALGSFPASGADFPSIGQSGRPESGEAHQHRAVYSHSLHPEMFQSQSEQKAGVSYGRNSVPPPPYVESVQRFTNIPSQPPQRPTAPRYGVSTSGTKAVMNPANQSTTNGGNGIPPYLAGQNAQVLRSIDHVYHPAQIGGSRSIPDSLIDPMQHSQAQFPVPSVMGAQTGEQILESYKSDDFDTQERRE
ncbi:uncharacterized protein EAE97_007442 [Botrytis byssoidea]|uniref:Uncharacterized protein n=1 Tax=Botrytis byssoidea TaxID=139641 RepID=A0A9P5INR2_9HELO|nr:uncharacterized protein EAE97_007442 [Botrytis byssoidea]KAF7939362.1 hypothetical protein EAE97_007442 [Botrytis byssoidea]